MSTVVVDRRRHRIVTPEGLPLSLEIATVGDRVAALALDVLAMVILTLAVTLVLWIPFVFAHAGGGAVFGALWLLSTFVIWNGYFLFFELRGRGVTPGKRRVGLKVVARNGGPLSTAAVFARNLMRELEFFLPLRSLLFLGFADANTFAWLPVVSLLWLGVLLALPLLNRDRARCGDLVAGTLVVVRPEVRLMPDVAELRKAEAVEEPRYRFTNEQLDMYGIRELQVLEDVLREDAHRPSRRGVLRKVGAKIAAKIGWPQEVADAEVIAFLQAFYRAQRSRLEQRLLLGERRESKRAGRLGADGKVVEPRGRARRGRRR